MAVEWPPSGVNFNLRNLPQTHHVIEYAGETQQRTVRICRCWQSRKFPYCDDSHKLLMESGDSIGPMIVKIEPHYHQTDKLTQGAKNTTTAPNPNKLMKVKQLVVPAMGLLAVVSLTGYLYRRKNSLLVTPVVTPEPAF